MTAEETHAARAAATRERGASHFRVVIQAGGRGERLRPLTLTTPKSLVEVAGVPMIERLVRQLADAGLRRLTILTAWLGDRIEAHLMGLDALPADIAWDFRQEPWGLGTVGGLAALVPCDAAVILVFGDLVTDLDFAKLVAVHDRSKASVTLASHIETHRLRLGEIIAEGEKVSGYREKPEKEFLICSGIAVFEPTVVALVATLPCPVGLGDVVNAAVRNGHRVAHWRHGSMWFDVNDAADIRHAADAVSRAPTPSAAVSPR